MLNSPKEVIVLELETDDGLLDLPPELRQDVAVPGVAGILLSAHLRSAGTDKLAQGARNARLSLDYLDRVEEAGAGLGEGDGEKEEEVGGLQGYLAHPVQHLQCAGIAVSRPVTRKPNSDKE